MSANVPMLFVTWQAPESRRIFPVARVLRLPNGRYEWAYVHAVSEAREQGFSGLPGYEDMDRVSVSAELPGLFAHRVQPRARRAARGVRAANDSFDPAPITLLVPLGEGRHERLEVFAPPLPAPLGRYWGVFVARGAGRIPGSEAALEALAPPEPLRLEPEPDNPVSPRALRLLRMDGAPIGYVPDYLASELADAGANTEATDKLAGDGFRVELVSSERVTRPPAAPLYSVTCRYTCGGELGTRLFRSERYRPMAAGAFALRH